MTNEEILENVALIKNATIPGENTAQRVGETLYGIANLSIKNETASETLIEGIKTLNGEIKTLEDNIDKLTRNDNNLSKALENQQDDINTLNSDVDSLESDTDTLKSYFTSNQGENDKPSINRWNIPYYLNEVMVWGGDVDGAGIITVSKALRSKNTIPSNTQTENINTINCKSLLNVYFTVTEDMVFQSNRLRSGDIILSTGTRWVTLLGKHPSETIVSENPEYMSFNLGNEDKYIHYYINDDNPWGDTYTVEAAAGDGQCVFHVLVTNNSTKDIMLTFPSNQVLIIQQGKEKYFEVKNIGNKCVFSINTSSDLEKKTADLESEAADLVNKYADLTTIKVYNSPDTVDIPNRSLLLLKNNITLYDNKDLRYWNYQFIIGVAGNININVMSEQVTDIKKMIVATRVGEEGSGKTVVEYSDWMTHTPQIGDKITIEKIVNKIIITHYVYIDAL